MSFKLTKREAHKRFYQLVSIIFMGMGIHLTGTPSFDGEQAFGLFIWVIGMFYWIFQDKLLERVFGAK